MNVLVKPSDSWEEQMTAVLDGVEGALAGEKLDAIFCVAGGWAGGNAKAKSECHLGRHRAVIGTDWQNRTGPRSLWDRKTGLQCWPMLP